MKTSKKEKKLKSSALVVVKPTAVTPPTVVPKPTKTEIIEAMVERARVLHAKQKEEFDKKRGELEDKIKEAAIKLIVAAPEAYAPELYMNHYGNRSAQIKFDVAGGLGTLLNQYRTLEKSSPGWFRPDDTRKMIKQGMDTLQDRVRIILSNEDNLSAIDAALAKIAGKKEVEAS